MQLMVLLASLLVSCLGTLGLRRYALAHQILDTPNARSSHVLPTPRGGGVAIVVSFLLAMVVWRTLGAVPSALFWALVPAGAAIALVGFWDDHVSLSARVRLCVHLLASAWAVWWLGGWPALDLGGEVVPWGWLGALIAVFGLTWAINLYNFMDGIDGLAGMEAVFAGVAGGFLLQMGGGDGMPLWLLAAAAGGFLIWNWPPARIFMGDAGSGFLGFALGVMVLHATTAGHTTIWPWLILLGVFVVDATLTLGRRAWLRIRVMDAHRTHAYQWASRRFGAHRPVTLSVLSINVCILLPVTLLTVQFPSWVLPACLISLGALGVLAWRFDAGKPETPAVRGPESYRDGAV